MPCGSQRSRGRRMRTGLSAHGGFLPPEIPLTSLPGPLRRYVDLCRELPRHYHAPDAHVRPWLDDAVARRRPGRDRAGQGADRAAVSSADDGPGIAGARLPLGLVAAAPGGAAADEPGASRPARRPVVAHVPQAGCPLRGEPVPLGAVELATAISTGRRPLRQRRAGGRGPRPRVPLPAAAGRPRGADAVHLGRGVGSPRRRGAAGDRGAAVSGRAGGRAPDDLPARQAPDRDRRHLARVRDRDPQAACCSRTRF